MHTTVDYAQRAQECRRLAKLAPKTEDWGHFLEMAETWELLLSINRTGRADKQSLSQTGFEMFYFSQRLRGKGRRKKTTTKRLLD